MTIPSLIGSYGYVMLFLLVGLESLGIPLPGETALVTAASLAALGNLSIYGVIITAAVAAILGDTGGYWIGRRGGLALLQRPGRFLRPSASTLERARTFFQRHGAKTVFFGRFIALLRTWAAVLAGAAGLPYGAFLLYNAAGGICWSVLFGTLGYAFGRNLPQLERYIGQASLTAVLLVALVASLVFGARWFDRNRTAVIGRLQSGWEVVLRLGRRYPRACSFISARFARGEYLGLHLTIGLIISLAGLWLFAGVTEDVVHGDPLTRFDVTVLQWFQVHATPTGYSIFQAITTLGSPIVMAVLGVVVGLLLAIRRQWIPLAGWAVAFAGAGVLTQGLKVMIRRPRPPGAENFLSSFSWSFPSGHAMGSLIGYGMLAYLLVALWAKRRMLRIGIVVVAAILILAIGFSRVYLGVHYFSDVIGGYAAATLWLAACISGVEVARRWKTASPSAQPAAESGVTVSPRSQ